jgi:exonuclease VII large subunit
MHQIDLASCEVDALGHVLATLNPDASFQRGFAWLENSDTNTPVRTVGELAVGSPVRATMRCGTIEATVETIIRNND